MPNKLKYEDVKKYINKHELLLSNNYVNNKVLLQIECNICKEIYNQTFDRYKRGHRHKKCTQYIHKLQNNQNIILALKKRYNTDVFIKDTIRICEICKNNFNPKYKKQKLCSKECAYIFHKTDVNKKEMSKFYGSKGGIMSAASQQRRSKNEIYMAELCIKHFGKADIICNQQIFKDKNGNFWDCDIFIKSLKTAILWDGWYYHYGTNVSNKQKVRDVLKRKIILDNGYKYYTIIDKGKFNKSFVEYEFYLFLHKVQFKSSLDQVEKKVNLNRDSL